MFSQSFLLQSQFSEISVIGNVMTDNKTFTVVSVLQVVSKMAPALMEYILCVRYHTQA